MKKVLFLFVSIFCSFLFTSQVDAKLVSGKCIYHNSQDSTIEKIELEFPFPSGNAVFNAYILPSWQQSGSATVQSIELDNRSTVQYKFRNENQVCPLYIVAAAGNWLHSGVRKYFAAYSNEEYESILESNKSWAGDFYTTFYKEYVEMDDGANPDGNPSREYKKTYYSSLLSSEELGDLNFSMIYDEVNASFKQQKLSFSKYSGSVKWVSSFDISGFQKNVLQPIISSESYPKEFWCGTIRAYFNVKSNVNYIIGGNSASNGDVVCSLEKSVFQDTNNSIIHYKTEREKPNGGSSGSNIEDPGQNSGGTTQKPVDKNPEPTIQNITTGKVCQDPNLKVVLKYIGWLLSAVKLIIPIVLIVLGVLDFMKAVTSQKPEELTKAMKTLLMRGIAGVVIFFVPVLVHFVFTLVDDWSPYKSAYSECTECLSNPRKC